MYGMSVCLWWTYFVTDQCVPPNVRTIFDSDLCLYYRVQAKKLLPLIDSQFFAVYGVDQNLCSGSYQYILTEGVRVQTFEKLLPIINVYNWWDCVEGLMFCR